MTNDFIMENLLSITGSIMQSANKPMCDTLKELTMQEIQTTSFDRLSLWVAIITCIIAIITCVFTYYQLRVQNKEFKDNQEKDGVARAELKTYVNQIKNQIFNDSLIRIIDAKYEFLECFNNLYEYLSKNSPLLLKSQKGGYDKAAIQDINRIKIHLSVIKDTMSVFEKEEKNLEEKESIETVSKEINDLLNKIEKQEGVGEDLTEVEIWLKTFKMNSIRFFQAIEASSKRIRQEQIK